MKKFLTVGLAVLALAGLTSCARAHKPLQCRECPPGIDKLPKQETVVMRLRMDGRQCKMEQKTPPEIRAEGGSTVRWLFVGACDDQVTLRIVPPADLFASMSLEYKGTVPRKGGDIELSGTLKSATEIKGGRYSYQVWINNKPAEYNPVADRGDFYACPVWPCDFQ